MGFIKQVWVMVFNSLHLKTIPWYSLPFSVPNLSLGPKPSQGLGGFEYKHPWGSSITLMILHNPIMLCDLRKRGALRRPVNLPSLSNYFLSWDYFNLITLKSIIPFAISIIYARLLLSFSCLSIFQHECYYLREKNPVILQTHELEYIPIYMHGQFSQVATWMLLRGAITSSPPPLIFSTAIRLRRSLLSRAVSRSAS